MTQQNFWKSLTNTATGFGETISNAAAQATQAATETAAKAGEAISAGASEATVAVAKTAAKAGEAISAGASEATVAVAKTALKTKEVISSAASETAAKAGEAMSIGASGATVAATKTALKAKEVISSAASGATQSAAKIANESGKSTNQTLDFAKLTESERVAFYGALFAIASADGSLDKEEMELIFGIMDLEGMSEPAKRLIQSYIIEPPALHECLKTLSSADENLRFSLMVNLIDTAWANDELDPNEEKAIQLAQQELRITNEQVKAIEKFIQEMKKIRARGLDDNQAADAIKTAAAGLSAVGIPIAAVYLCGSVIGLSAAGITSGLAALGAFVGVGGMVPGIGVAVLLGTGIFMGVSHLLDTGDKQKKAQFQAEKERKAQLVIKNLQETLNGVIEKIEELQKAAADAEMNREAIRILTEKMRYLQQLLAKRKQAGV
ncbi:MAG: TerB family tellurite resistance protein [Microcoleus vaginatus WJT46-NPBG5]|jgi:uncharacterized tellurite resistance protein B-like protein|nr:TerB family tellurite resistance protein [Microcoleus vaginatus WJT46-NPBG5]